MPTDILISSDPWENRVAILEQGSLAEIYIEREEKVIGSIYKGKVQNVLPGMGASFVDIGIGRNAFLYVDDINKTPLNIGDVEITQGRSGWTIGEKVNRGDDVLVQIVKEPRGLKGARVSTNISLPGRYLILMPTGKFSGVSRKIDSADERNRLKSVMKRIRPDGMATIVRTAAAGVSDAELIADLGVLIRMWHGILENYKSSPTPSLVHKDMNLVYKAARDFITPEIERVLIDNADECEKLRDFMRLLSPQYVERISYYPQGKALFRDFKVEEEITKLMRPKVNLPSGGSLVIETTEALTVIDVNSGKYAGGKTHEDTILHTNLEAAAEIARQVRLRDIGGIIVCDFIDMDREASRSKVLATLETGLRRDRTRTTIQSFSALGLLEFTRKRVGKDLSGQLRSHCPTCRGIGSVLSPETVTIETFRTVEHHRGHDSAPVTIVASPTVGAQIRYWYDDELTKLGHNGERQISLAVDPSAHPERTRVTTDPSHVPHVASPQMRVGDEFEVDILPFRMPNPSSGVAALGSRLIEIENASGAIGSTLGIRIIDIDDETGDILAEPRGPVASLERKRRRRGGKRGRPLSPEEQVEELRELAEEAARIAAMAPAERPVRPAAAASTTATPAGAPAFAAAATAAPAPHQQRGRRPHGRPIPGQQRPAAAASGAPASDAPAPFRQRQAAPPPVEADVAGYDDQFAEPLPFYEDQAQARVRRRGFGERPITPLADGISVPPRAVEALDDAGAEDEGDEGFESPNVAGAVPFNDGQRRRRRRRRRGRGRGGAGSPDFQGQPQPQAPAENGAIPNRSIFRVSANGTTEQTGQIAPPEPSRAIAPWRPRHGHVAIDAPPPSISPDEAGGPPLARPARRRGRPPKTVGGAPAPTGQLTSAPRPALPPAAPRVTAAVPPPLRAGSGTPILRPAAPVRPVTEARPAPPPARPGTPPLRPAAVTARPVVSIAEQAPEAPRRRGRPPRALASAVVPKPVAAEAMVQAAPETAPKRRGRPPKAAAVESSPAKATTAPAAKAKVVAKAAAPARATPGRKKSAEPATAGRRKKTK